MEAGQRAREMREGGSLVWAAGCTCLGCSADGKVVAAKPAPFPPNLHLAEGRGAHEHHWAACARRAPPRAARTPPRAWRDEKTSGNNARQRLKGGPQRNCCCWNSKNYSAWLCKIARRRSPGAGPSRLPPIQTRLP